MATWDALFIDTKWRLYEPADELLRFESAYLDGQPLSIIDIGCGCGRHLVYLSRRGHRVTGVDIALMGLEASRRWLADEGLEADIRIADMRALPFEDESFDAGLCRGVITHGTRYDIDRALQEAHRVLRP